MRRGLWGINKEQYAQVDINGTYPVGPNQPFGGFGRVDPNAGLLYRVTNNTWSQMQYRALQVTVAKNLTNGFQFLVAVHRQWQHLTARGIRPTLHASSSPMRSRITGTFGGPTACRTRTVSRPATR